MFRSGNFAVKRTKGSFNKIPSDQCIEQTINRDQKCSGGIIGFCASEGGVQRWVLTSHIAAKCMSRLRSVLGIKPKSITSKDLSPSRKNHHNKQVESAYAVLKNWGNPFSNRESLVNISSGVQATKEVQSDVVNDVEFGESNCLEFISKKIMSAEVSFYDPIKK